MSTVSLNLKFSYDYLNSIFLSSSISSTSRSISSSFYQLSSSYYYMMPALTHVSQTEEWDCGVACICMILLWINKQYGMSPLSLSSTRSPTLYELKTQHNWNKPLWTIEIFYFLKSYGIEVTYFTKFLGVGHHHSNLEWYSEHLDEDTQRVESLLLATQANNWLIFQSTLTLDEFLSYFNNSTVAIVLVDINLLSTLSSNPMMDFDTKEVKDLDVKVDYVGHYIVVLGYQQDLIAYLDPALSSEIRWMPSLIFDAIRRSLGTDEDILFCHNFLIAKSFPFPPFPSIPTFLQNLTQNGERFLNSFFSLMFSLQQHRNSAEDQPQTNAD